MGHLETVKSIFASRLTTLEHLLKKAGEHFDNEGFLQERIIEDMLPLSTQIVFCCNQPHNFALSHKGKPMENLDPDRVTTFQDAYQVIADTQQELSELVLQTDDDKRQEEDLKMVRVDLGGPAYLELPRADHVHQFLMPNFYFHLVTAYNILRKNGVKIGKQDYMLHMVPFVKSD